MVLGSRQRVKRTSEQKKCQYHRAAETYDKIAHKCDRKIDNNWHHFEVCERHRRILQDFQIERLKTYQEWDREIDTPA
jgi:hypothetical protein